MKLNGWPAALIAAAVTVVALIPGTASAAQSPSAQAARGPGATLAAAMAGPVNCHDYTVPVALASGQPANYSVWGELCATPAEMAAGTTVQLLIHGATYTHVYWDFGTTDGIRYSYARDLAAAGIPTFAIDQLGAGNSSQPPSADITIQVAAFADHQVVQALLTGGVGGVQFGKVVLVGHSFGSIAGSLEAATYHDVAGVILTGIAHSQPSFPVQAEQDLYPAIDDPMFANSGLDPGYLTTVPGTRGYLFYNLRDAGSAVITADEASKGVISGTEFGTGLPVQTSPITNQITVPVLIVDGSKDQIDCGPQVGGGTYDCSSGAAIAQQEAPYYAAAAQLRACVVPNSGHDINLALNHVLLEVIALAWTREYVGGLRSRALPGDCSS